jgi:hypothetical protein
MLHQEVIHNEDNFLTGRVYRQILRIQRLQSAGGGSHWLLYPFVGASKCPCPLMHICDPCRQQVGFAQISFRVVFAV